MRGDQAPASRATEAVPNTAALQTREEVHIGEGSIADLYPIPCKHMQLLKNLTELFRIILSSNVYSAFVVTFP